MASAGPTLVEPCSPHATPKPTRRRALWSRLVMLALVVCFFAKLWHLLLGGNIHTVIPGKIYRGAQPKADTLAWLVKQHGIRTVVNLRGGCYPQAWYVQEATAAQELGLNLEDISFSAGRGPSYHEIRQLVQVLDRAEYPMFLHCRQGADRTGLACAVAMILHGDASYAQARRQLGLRYGHLPVGRATILDTFFDEYEAWLTKTQRTHDVAAFRHWALEKYRGAACQAAIEEVTPVHKVARVGLPLAWRVRVRNVSQETWRFSPIRTAGIHAAYTFWDKHGHVTSGRAAMFDRAVEPGESVTVIVPVPPVTKPGRCRVMFDFVQEQHCWFYQAGSQPYEEEFDVRD